MAKYVKTGLGNYTPKGTSRLVCEVCGDKGWVKAMPVAEVNPAAEVTIETNPRINMHEAITVPCWACPTANLGVLA